MSESQIAGRWKELERPLYVTDVVRCANCGVMIPRRYWDLGADLTHPYCSPECVALESRLAALRERYSGLRPFPSLESSNPNGST
jgi:hypothetical protein